MEEPSNNRPLSDRKRKFVDTELAQDTEGKITDVKNQKMWLAQLLLCLKQWDLWKAVTNIFPYLISRALPRPQSAARDLDCRRWVLTRQKFWKVSTAVPSPSIQHCKIIAVKSIWFCKKKSSERFRICHYYYLLLHYFKCYTGWNLPSFKMKGFSVNWDNTKTWNISLSCKSLCIRFLTHP